jgi:hypothetical protein
MVNINVFKQAGGTVSLNGRYTVWEAFTFSEHGNDKTQE